MKKQIAVLFVNTVIILSAVGLSVRLIPAANISPLAHELAVMSSPDSRAGGVK